MIKNYFKTAWRTITGNIAFSSINIIGLTIALAASMVVATIVIDDLSYDKQWSHSNEIYRINTVNRMGDGMYNKFSTSFVGLVNTLKKDFPEVEAAAPISTSSMRLKVNEADPNGMKISSLEADTSLWNILDLKVLSGNPRKLIAGDNANLVITESFRKKFFPNENPVGKIIDDVPTYSTKAKPYIITGVIKDLPVNSIFRADVVEMTPVWDEQLTKEQFGSFAQNFVLFKKGSDVKKFTDKLNSWYAGFVNEKNPYQFEFQPLEDIYLHSDFASYQPVRGDYKTILILGGISVLLLIIACVNFINLSTSRAVYRLKETGIRKILGAGRKQLISQLLTESLLFFIVSSILAVILYVIALPAVVSFVGHPFGKDFINTPSLLVSVFVVAIVLSVITGFYPAWVLSGFRSIAMIKGKLTTHHRSSQSFVRKSLIVVQFAISIFVLIALIVIQNQVKFMTHRDIGFDKNNLLNISYINWNGKSQTFKNELKKIPGVVSTSISTWTPGNGAGYMSRMIDNPDRPNEKINVWYINGDADLPQTLGLRLEKGRFFDPNLKSDAPPPSVAENMEMRSAILTSYTSGVLHADLNKYLSNVKVVPVGIIKDFNNETLKSPMQPTIITAEDSLNMGSMIVRVEPGMQQSVLNGIHELWRSFFPVNLLEIKWVDEMVNGQYKAEKKLSTIFIFFSSISMALAALGILGLVIQATAQRIKEIGIRKVLGASVGSIVQMFSVSFIKLIALSILIASPIAWWLMNKWLMDYAYRIHVSWWMLVVAGFITIAISLAVISFQTIKAAVANPADSLRTE